MTSIEIVGFKFPGGYLRYEGRLLVLYGQNGAGKSLLLESIATSMTGMQVGRMEASEPSPSEPITSAALVRATPQGLEYFAPSDFDPSVANMARALVAARADAESWWGDGLEPGEDGEFNPGIAAGMKIFDEIAQSDHAALTPSASAQPQWRGYLTTDPDSSVSSAWASAFESDMISSIWDPDVFQIMSDLDGGVRSDGTYRFNRSIMPLEGEPFGTVFTDDNADPDLLVARWLDAIGGRHAYTYREQPVGFEQFSGSSQSRV